MLEELKFHHIGVACKNIEKEFSYFSTLGYKASDKIFIDEIQKIKGLFIEAPNQPRLELLENLTPDGPLTNFLAKGNKFYHLAYETLNIEEDAKKLCAQGAIIIKPSVPATYFNKVCFLMLKNMLMIELVEKKITHSLEKTNKINRLHDVGGGKSDNNLF